MGGSQAKLVLEATAFPTSHPQSQGVGEHTHIAETGRVKGTLAKLHTLDRVVAGTI